MDEIVKRLHRVCEMAYERRDAIDRCASLGEKFIEHFHKVYSLGVEDRDFEHHCQEMQSWYDSVKDIVLKSSNRKLSNNQLIDWFFTKGSSTEYLFKDEVEVDEYNEFIVNLLSNRRSGKVADLLRDQFS